MISLSQNDKRWANLRLGTSEKTFKSSACFVVSLSMLADRLPTDTNADFIKAGVYKLGCLIGDPQKAAEVLDIKYDGKIPATVAPNFTCIAETNYYAPVVKQHFFVRLANGRIIDPIDGREQPNKYRNYIVSYRLFKEKESQHNGEDMNATHKRHWVKMITLAYGLVPTPQHVDYWSGESEDRIMNYLPSELCKLADPDGTASARQDYFNKMKKTWTGTDVSPEKQKEFSERQAPLREVTDFILSETK